MATSGCDMFWLLTGAIEADSFEGQEGGEIHSSGAYKLSGEFRKVSLDQKDMDFDYLDIPTFIRRGILLSQ